jgi:CBS domain containing-hemolysin-like protein
LSPLLAVAPPPPPLFADQTTGIDPVVGLILIPVLVLVNAFFVAAEFALVAIRRTRVEELVQEGGARAQTLLAAVDDLNDSVAAAQVGITVASLALGLVSEPALAELLRPVFAQLPAAWQGAVAHGLSIALTLLLVTYLHVVFGEQMPKLAALQSSERVALWVAAPLRLFTRLTRPLVKAMNGSSKLFLRCLGFRLTGEEGEVHSVQELRLLIEDTEEAGLIEPEAADFVLNVFALTDKKVADVMVLWEKVAALELTSPPEKILEAVREGAHTRMPVYEGHKDNIVGIVNTKDLFYLFSLKGVVVLEDAQYPAQFLPPDEPVATALRLFRKTKRPMAVVRRTDGQVVGILTLEDVLEEIIGDIEDEHDDPARRRELIAKALRRGPPRPPNRPR